MTLIRRRFDDDPGGQVVGLFHRDNKANSAQLSMAKIMINTFPARESLNLTNIQG